MCVIYSNWEEQGECDNEHGEKHEEVPEIFKDGAEHLN